MNNQTMLIGHVGAQPEITYFASGAKLAKFSLAVKEMPGTDKETTFWAQIEAWGNVADRVEKAVTKGREVVVTGRLSVSAYTSKKKDGSEVEVERPVIKLNTFHLCGKKPEAEGSGTSEFQADGEGLAVAEPAAKTRRTRSAA